MSKKTFTYLVIGIVFGLLFAIGMCMALLPEWNAFKPGIFIGIIGMAAVIAAYPMYAHITKKERERIAPEILRLTEELMQ